MRLSGETEVGGQSSDDLVGSAADLDLPAYHPRVAAELPLPIAMAYDDYGRRIRTHVSRPETAATLHLDPQEWKEIP